MATKWQITKAVRASDLPAPSRLIMLVLADVAEVGTAEIPAKFTPSLSVLAGETGLDESTVKRHLISLEKAGWMVRTRPDAKAQWAGERTHYRLTLPRGSERPEVGAEDTQVGAESATLGAHSAQGGRTQRPGVGAEKAPGGRTVRPLETDQSDQSQTNVRSSEAEPSDVAIPDRIDVEKVCRHLADRIEANGSKRPTVTKAWRDAARRLIDRDGRTVGQVIKAIDWCQDDEFWRSNILSMPKLREKYDQLRLAAQRGNGNGNGNQPYVGTSDRKVAQVDAVVASFKAQMNGGGL